MYEPCLLLDPQVAMFGLALARKIFHPKAGLVDAGSIYRVQVPSGLKSQPLPLDPDKLDDPVFSELTYAILRTALKRIAQFTGIEWDTKPYTFRYGHGEEINLSSKSIDLILLLLCSRLQTTQRGYQPRAASSRFGSSAYRRISTQLPAKRHSGRSSSCVPRHTAPK